MRQTHQFLTPAQYILPYLSRLKNSGNNLYFIFNYMDYMDYTALFRRAQSIQSSSITIMKQNNNALLNFTIG